ncbi:MAG: phosphate ABC transporter permease PstA [Deltaproteobacteria bacterium]|nr:phosphate ABC transporter permease PstA [Deltaproteobacteria bacterium]
MDSYRRRRYIDKIARGACIVALLLALTPLVSLLIYVASKGLGGISLEFFTELPKPVGELGGGFANAIIGTLVLVGIATAISLPLGVLAGVYLSEFGGSTFTKIVRFSADVMSGVPSIAVGVFIYTLIVVAMRQFSAFAGGLALSIIMLPTITRTTEELIRLVPNSLREAGLALGMPKWRVIVRIVLRTGAPGIVTGVMLAIARAAGETAPLLFTALNNRFWSISLAKPIASLPVQIYTYAVSPFEDWHKQAWTAALVLVVMVLVLNIGARIITYTRGGN